MTKKEYRLIGTALLFSLFIYLFYRTEKTVVTALFIQAISLNTFIHIKAAIVKALPLHNVIIYSLPEGLWTFCITLTSKPYYIFWGKHRLDCVFIPVIYCVLLELLQLAHITNGRFDYLDILFSAIFWLLASYRMPERNHTKPLTTKLNISAAVCYGSYGIVYLAHVLN